MKDARTLREKARQAMLSGELPDRRPDSTWGGQGAGDACTICGEPVARDEADLEIEFVGADARASRRRYHMHPRCFVAWESERLVPDPERRNGGASG